MSGDGAAIHGGRFNPAGVPALYLSLSIEGAIREANQGFSFKIDPCTLCSYEIDCNGVIDLRTDPERAMHDVTQADLACPWFELTANRREPPTWRIARRLMAEGHDGIVVPSFAPGATVGDQNLVLWKCGPRRPHRVQVFDPSGRLPKNQLSWE